MTKKLNIYGSPGDKFIIGLHGCRCHPYDSWSDLKKYMNQKIIEGTRFKDRCSGKQGIIKKINKTGHINVTYDPAQYPSDSSTIHKQNIILL